MWANVNWVLVIQMFGLTHTGRRKRYFVTSFCSFKFNISFVENLVKKIPFFYDVFQVFIKS